jgi:hypothetical protein
MAMPTGCYDSAVSDPRRHHTVPALHLRGFANDRSQVRVVARDDFKRTFIAGVDDATVQRDFYAVETPSGLSQHVEEFLSILETNAAPAIARMLGGTFPPSDDDRAHIATFVAAQWLRGWDMREAMALPMAHTAQMLVMNATKESYRLFFKETENREASDEEIEDLIAFARDPSRYTVEVHPNETIRQMLQMIPGLTNLVFARKWQLLRATAGTFLTSDAPVTLWTHPKNRHPFYGNGFASADEVALPLDRRHALVLAHDAPRGEITRDVGIEYVRALNLRTAGGARRQIIHHPDDSPLGGMVLPPSRPKMSVSQPPFRMSSADE